MKIKNVAAVFFCVSILTGPSITIGAPVSQFGQKKVEEKADIQVGQREVNLTGRIGVGYLSGESNELIYNPDGTRLSQLIWELDAVFMAGGGISLQLSPGFLINADLWVAVSEGSGEMNDYDWFFAGKDWSHWSRSENTPLESGYILDINAEIPVCKTAGANLSALVGFKRDSWKWQAIGGEFIYSIPGFRDSAGRFPDDQLGITYEQSWNAPYIGLGVAFKRTSLDVDGRIIYSPIVQADSVDHHHQRSISGIRFDSSYDRTTMIGADLAVTYRFNPKWGLIGALKYQYYDEAKGSISTTDVYTGLRGTSSGDSSEMDNYSMLFMMSLNYAF